MTRAIDSATLAALSGDHVKWLIFAKVDLNGGTLAFNSSLRDRVFNGLNYSGAGDLGSVSGLSESGSLNPSDYEISFSAVNDTTLNLIVNEQYMNNLAEVHLACVDDSDAIIGSPFLWFRGLTDSVTVEYGKNSIIRVQVRDRLADWSRRRVSRYTDQEQQLLHPGDLGLQYVSEVASKEVEWPNKTWFEKNA